jgi:outer membrane receptor protein involved in Fe transport
LLLNKGMTMLRQVLRRWVVVLALSSIGVVGVAQAESQRFTVPGGSLAIALNTIAQQAGVSIAADPKLLRDKNVAALSGEFSVTAILATLLAGTELEAVQSADGWIVRRKSTPAAPSEESPASKATPTVVPAESELNEITVSGRRPREFSDEPIDGYKADGTSALGFELELQQTPATVSILSADFLKDAAVRKLNDALNLLPGVTIGDNFGTPREGVLIRGYRAEPTVNGIPQAITTRPAFSFANIERVEVIKGIAGVEGNVDDFGGTLDLVTKKPLRDLTRQLTVASGDYGYWDLIADASGPLNTAENWQYRLIAHVNQPQNWRPGRPDSNIRYELFPSLNWDYAAGSGVLVELGYIYLDDPLDRGGLYIEGAGFEDNLTPRSWSIHQRDNKQTQNYRQIDLTWNHRFSPDWSFKLNAQRTWNTERTVGFLGGETEGEFLFAADGVTWNGTAVEIPIFFQDDVSRYDSHGFTAEVRGNFNTGDIAHQVRVALAGSTGDDSFGFGATSPFFPLASNTINLFSPDNNQQPQIVGQEGPFYPTFNRGVEKESAAVQWLGEWTQRFRTLFGIRREYTDTFTFETGADPDVVGFPPFTDSQNDLRTQALRVGASYDIRDDLSVFVTYGDGSFAQSAVGRDSVVINDPRTVNNIETGVKWTFAEGKALASAAVYSLRERNLLTADCLPSEEICFFEKLVGGRRIRGIEFDIRGEVATDLQIGVTFSPQRGRIIESPSGFSGNRFSNNPKNQASAFANYRWSAWGVSQLTTSFGAVHVAERFGNSGNTVRLPAYTLLNLGANWQFSETLDLSFSANNLLDENYYTAMQDNDSAASDQVAVGDRRLWQVTLDWRF